MGSDKPIPDRSPIFAIQYGQEGFKADTLRYLKEAPFVKALKYEDFTLTPNGEHIIAITGFDRIKPDSHKWDPYNTLLIWPVGHPEKVSVVSPSTNNGITGSVSLRQKFSSALKNDRYPDGMPYFKVEGLAATPGDTLLIGIREAGKAYDDFDYAIILIAVSYTIQEDKMTLADDFRVIYDYAPASLPLKHTVGLSSIEYDRYANRLYLLTSYEEAKTDEGLGGFLWTLPLAALEARRAPTLVMKKKRSWPHKAEGVAVLDAQRVLILHDDDRVLGRERIEDPEIQFSRKAHQAPYSLVEFLD